MNNNITKNTKRSLVAKIKRAGFEKSIDSGNGSLFFKQVGGIRVMVTIREAIVDDGWEWRVRKVEILSERFHSTKIAMVPGTVEISTDETLELIETLQFANSLQ